MGNPVLTPLICSACAHAHDETTPCMNDGMDTGMEEGGVQGIATMLTTMGEARLRIQVVSVDTVGDNHDDNHDDNHEASGMWSNLDMEELGHFERRLMEEWESFSSVLRTHGIRTQPIFVGHIGHVGN